MFLENFRNHFAIFDCLFINSGRQIPVFFWFKHSMWDFITFNVPVYRYSAITWCRYLYTVLALNWECGRITVLFPNLIVAS